MTDMITYLRNFREEEPEWLKDYFNGKKFTFKDIMSSRVGFYPGYYLKLHCDGTLIRVGNKSHSVHSFLYVDHIKRKYLEDEIAKENSFLGYHPVGSPIEWQESDLIPSGQHPILRTTFNIQENPYCFSIIMNRDEDKDDSWGAEHFVVTFLFGDSINVYYRLFRKEYSKAPWLFFLNERYKGTYFERDIQNSHRYPPYVIFANNANIWKEYEKVENISPVGGVFNRRHDLYKYNNNLI
jgi:hypothetical protein